MQVDEGLPIMRRDTCSCGALRIELLAAPGRFYCASCRVAGPGPGPVVGAGAPGQQLALGLGIEPASPYSEGRPA
jgi:hypothetical protein